EIYRRIIYPVWATGEEWNDCIPLSLSAEHYVDARGERYAAGLAELAATLAVKEHTFATWDGGGEAAPLVEPRNPYKGLRAFSEGDAGDFFGRGAIVADLVAALREILAPGTAAPARLLTVVGPSGSGKSSLVMAGLLPRLKQSAVANSETWVYLPPMV